MLQNEFFKRENSDVLKQIIQEETIVPLSSFSKSNTRESEN